MKEISEVIMDEIRETRRTERFVRRLVGNRKRDFTMEKKKKNPKTPPASANPTRAENVVHSHSSMTSSEMDRPMSSNSFTKTERSMAAAVVVSRTPSRDKSFDADGEIDR